MKNEKFDSLQELINNILNTNAMLILLNKKGLLSSDEFIAAKMEALEELKKDFPNLFKKE